MSGPGDNSTRRPASVQIEQLQVQGFINPTTEVANFLGIQYATIPARFRQAHLVDHSSQSGILDATQYGPRCPQSSRPGGEAQIPLFLGQRRSHETPVDEFGCLRLNIYTPPWATTTSHQQQLLPVVVWIHGGGFAMGDGGADFDGNYLVRHSIDNSKPVVYVALNYRLGHFGFLWSKELEAEAVRDGETPFQNIAFCDQRTALLWIQKHIRHFGGDPDQITIAGESAGGLSVLAHLRSNVPVCQRGIIMSCPNLDYPRPEEVQATFEQLVDEACSISGAPLSSSPLSDNEKLMALRDLTADDMVRLMGTQFATPKYDKEWFTYQDPDRTTAGPAPFAPWVKAVLAGTTRDEAALFTIVRGLQKWTFAQFEERVKSAIPDPELAKELMDVYGLSDKADGPTNFRGVLDMITDCSFTGVPYILAEQEQEESDGKGLGTPPVSVYRFDQQDTFKDSPLYGYAYHALDNAYFCRLPSVAGPNAAQDTKATADKMSEATLALAYGDQPWETYREKQTIMVFNGTASRLEHASPENRWRTIVERESGDPRRTRILRRAGHRLMGLLHASLP
ncbi:hypothetical protein ABEF95_009280 [Exophiala dermatitidis]